MRTPSPGRMLGAIGRHLQGLRYVIADVLYVLGHVPRALARSGRAFWGALSLATRRRLVAAIGFLVAVLVFLALIVPNLPCELPGGDECPPAEDALALVPSGSLAYVHANLDSETEQYAAALELANRAPLITRQIAGQLLPLLIGSAGRPSDFGTEIEPWFGGEVAIAVVPGGAGTPQVQLLEVDDDGAAREYAESIAAGVPVTTEYQGVELIEDERGLVSAIVDGFLVLGTGSGVRAVVDVASGVEGAESLESDGLAQAALDLLPEHRLADAYFSADGVEAFFADRRSTLATFEPLVDSASSEAVAASIAAEGDGFDVAVRSVLDPEQAEGRPGFFAAFEPFDPELPERLAPDALAYLGLGDPSKTVPDLLAQASAQAPDIAAGLTDLIGELRDEEGVDLERDLFSSLQGEAALTLVPRPSEEPEPEGGLPGEEPPPTLAPGVSATPYVEFLATEVDAEETLDALARLQRPIARTLGGRLGAPVFDQEQIDEADVQILRVSPTAQLSYAVVDSLLVLASDPAGVARVAGQDDDGLAGTDAYEASVGELPEDPSLVAYLDLDGLLGFAERSGLAEDPAYAAFAPDLRRLDTLGLTISSSPVELAADITLRVAPR